VKRLNVKIAVKKTIYITLKPSLVIYGCVGNVVENECRVNTTQRIGKRIQKYRKLVDNTI
jgi:hypothetical protein